jgi:hypothetical protein
MQRGSLSINIGIESFKQKKRVEMKKRLLLVLTIVIGIAFLSPVAAIAKYQNGNCA